MSRAIDRTVARRVAAYRERQSSECGLDRIEVRANRRDRHLPRRSPRSPHQLRHRSLPRQRPRSSLADPGGEPAGQSLPGRPDVGVPRQLSQTLPPWGGSRLHRRGSEDDPRNDALVVRWSYPPDRHAGRDGHQKDFLPSLNLQDQGCLRRRGYSRQRLRRRPQGRP